MRFEGLIVLFFIIVIIVAVFRFLWPLILIFALYALIKSIFFPTNRPTTTTYRQEPDYEQTQSRPRQQSGPVIDAEFEAREIKDED